MRIEPKEPEEKAITPERFIEITYGPRDKHAFGVSIARLMSDGSATSKLWEATLDKYASKHDTTRASIESGAAREEIFAPVIEVMSRMYTEYGMIFTAQQKLNGRASVLAAQVILANADKLPKALGGIIDDPQEIFTLASSIRSHFDQDVLACQASHSRGN